MIDIWLTFKLREFGLSFLGHDLWIIGISIELWGTSILLPFTVYIQKFISCTEGFSCLQKENKTRIWNRIRNTNTGIRNGRRQSSLLIDWKERTTSATCTCKEHTPQCDSHNNWKPHGRGLGQFGSYNWMNGFFNHFWNFSSVLSTLIEHGWMILCVRSIIEVTCVLAKNFWPPADTVRYREEKVTEKMIFPVITS